MRGCAGQVLADMDAADTAYTYTPVDGHGGDTVGIVGSATFFSGSLEY